MGRFQLESMENKGKLILIRFLHANGDWRRLYNEELPTFIVHLMQSGRLSLEDWDGQAM